VNLEEFVAHSSSVNCLKIGRKSSRVLVTGGEDNKVNIWAIGKPNAILVGTSLAYLASVSLIYLLSGHMSAVESVSFDSSEILVAAGAASGSIKLWDLEEAKIVRTLTGHRSNCIAVDFHPFGEFFASGSLDTNLKIWDIRRKGCIHTYKGHSRGVNAIKFTPDGRWVVSGGEDNTVKVLPQPSVLSAISNHTAHTRRYMPVRPLIEEEGEEEEKKRENLEKEEEGTPDPLPAVDFFVRKQFLRPRAISSPRTGRRNISPRGEKERDESPSLSLGF
ncbi:hypothetical protein B296_00057750, partial [Ensete ventricosum]